MDDAGFLTAQTIIAGVLGCPSGEITADAAIGSLPQWDSLAHISIIMAVEAELGRMMSAEEIVSFETVGNLAALFRPKQEGIQ